METPGRKLVNYGLDLILRGAEVGHELLPPAP
jgi:hypothetical protein